MSEQKFEMNELEVAGYVDVRGKDVAVYNYPISLKENGNRVFRHQKPCWLMTDVERQPFAPSIIPDQCARAYVFESKPLPAERFGGKDMFGVEWVYVPTVGGSMVMPGHPILEDVNDWREVIKFPDIESWDWEGNAEMNREWLEKSDRCVVLTLLNGCWFERLLSFMDFEGAAMALIDDDQVDAVKELIHETTNLYIRILEKCCQYYKFDGVCIHDDWGSQMAPFFSQDVAEEVFLPEMKRFVSRAHELGKFVDLHSCGHAEDRVGVFIEAGFDAWVSMTMNDHAGLLEKYGDKMAFGCNPVVRFDPETASEEEQRAAADDYVKRFVKKGKNAILFNGYCPNMMTPAFREQLYIASRKAYLEWDN